MALAKDRKGRYCRTCDSCGGVQYSVNDTPPMGLPEGCESLGFSHTAHTRCVSRCQGCYQQFCRTCLPFNFCPPCSELASQVASKPQGGVD